MLNDPALLWQILLRKALDVRISKTCLRCSAIRASTASEAHHLVTGSISDLLANKLVHPIFLLVVGAAGGHQAWHYERHGGFPCDSVFGLCDEVRFERG